MTTELRNKNSEVSLALNAALQAESEASAPRMALCSLRTAMGMGMGIRRPARDTIIRIYAENADKAYAKGRVEEQRLDQVVAEECSVDLTTLGKEPVTDVAFYFNHPLQHKMGNTWHPRWDAAINHGYDNGAYVVHELALE
jgi:hypothetical protein